MIVDTHSHLNFKAYNSDREEVIKRTQKESVVCVDVGVDFETSKKAVGLAQKYENIFAAIGLHPTESEIFDRNKYLELAKSKKVVAIGEIGLDYFKNKDKKKQKEIFLQQLDLARELDLPVIIHCRLAHDEMIKILSAQIAVDYKKVAGVVHCFTGTLDEMRRYLNLGFYIGFNGIIFPAKGGPASGWKIDLENTIKECPLDKILVETDCPYLTPPAAGVEKNEPIFVKHVIQKIADLKGTSFQEIADKTTENAKKLFKI